MSNEWIGYEQLKEQAEDKADVYERTAQWSNGDPAQTCHYSRTPGEENEEEDGE